MRTLEVAFAGQILAQARHSLQRHHLPRIVRCLEMLSEKEIWWRAHPTSNSVGNLVLHLEGNVRQWIISGLGGTPDRRQRDQEFAARGPIPRRELLARLRRTVAEACRLLATLSPADLAGSRTIQGLRVTGLEALLHVTEHFAGHTGQIIFVTKLKRHRDLRFTRLPGKRLRVRRAKRLPVL
jgi:uncharacterized damage-inducible protein DinB